MKKPIKKLNDIIYVSLKTNIVSCDGDMTNSIDGHPKVYMNFSSKKSRSLVKDINKVQCDYCGRQFIKK